MIPLREMFPNEVRQTWIERDRGRTCEPSKPLDMAFLQRTVDRIERDNRTHASVGDTSLFSQLLTMCQHVAGVARLAKDKRGVIAIEAAIVMPALAMMLVGMFDIGAWSLQANAAQSGLAAGGAYVMTNTSAAGTENVVRAANTLLNNATVTVTPVGNKVSITVSTPFVGVSAPFLPLPTSITASGSFMLYSNGGNSLKTS